MSNETTTTVKTGKRGRPTVDGSARQARLAKRAERAAQGYAIKRGRPKKQVEVSVAMEA